MSDGCGGCQYHEFPYKAFPPFKINGERKEITFKCREDVYNIIDLLIEEVHENNKKGKEFDVAKSIDAQLPFFTCKNHIFDKNIQEDIKRYMYCSELCVSPYKGVYGEQPYMWVERFFNIKKAFAKKEASQIEKAKSKKG